MNADKHFVLSAFIGVHRRSSAAILFFARRMQEMLTAITRAVSPTIAACELTYSEREAIDFAGTREQHRAYDACLAELGVTARSNTAGIGQLAAEVEPLGYRVRPVVVRGCLHLKSACSYLGDAVLVHRPWVDEAAFDGVRLVDVPEACGANVLAIGQTVLVPAAAPRTAELLIGLGRQVRVLDNSELMKAEGALTCCSLIFRT